MEAHAAVATASARRYLGQFVNHFSHKLPFARLDTNEAGTVTFPAGICSLAADGDVLTIVLTTDAAGDMARLQDVVARHLIRFAFREDLEIAWDLPVSMSH